MATLRPRSPWPALVLLAFFLAGAGAWWVSQSRPEEYRVFVRPDGAYRVVVYRRPIRPATAPGQAGDAPGIVRLYDSTGALLAETPVAMVQLVEDVDWSNDRATIKLVADWPLPPPRRK